jgi:hypothetical protein
VNGFDAGFAQSLFQSQIEIRCIDTDKYVGGRCYPTINEALSQTKQTGQVGEWFHEAKNGQRFSRFPLIATGGAHQWTGHTLESGFWILLFYRRYEARAQYVAGRLTSNQADPHGRTN